MSSLVERDGLIFIAMYDPNNCVTVIAADTFEFVYQMDIYSSAWGMCFGSDSGDACECSNRLYFTTVDIYDPHCIMVVSPATGRFDFIANQEKEMRFPHKICSHQGLLYICMGERIVVYRCSDGAFIRVIGGGEFKDAVCCSISDDMIYVADRDTCRVTVITLLGEVVGRWGSKGDNEDQFKLIQGVHCDGQFVYVADSSGDTIYMFTLDGDLLTHWTCAYNPVSLLALDNQVWVGYQFGFAVFQVTPAATTTTTNISNNK